MGVEIDGLTWLNAEIELGDSTKAYGIVAISRQDSGEHWATLIHLPGGGVADQDDDDFLDKLGKTKEQVFMQHSSHSNRGYRYRYFPEHIRGRDHHINSDTGWSR